MSVLENWFNDLTTWLRELFEQLWQDLQDYSEDFVMWLWSGLLDVLISISAHIPFPDALNGVTLCGLMSLAGPTVGWIWSQLQLTLAFQMIGAAYAYRLLPVFRWLKFLR